jgi:hypothetical protein
MTSWPMVPGGPRCRTVQHRHQRGAGGRAEPRPYPTAFPAPQGRTCPRTTLGHPGEGKILVANNESAKPFQTRKF